MIPGDGKAEELRLWPQTRGPPPHPPHLPAGQAGGEERIKRRFVLSANYHYLVWKA